MTGVETIIGLVKSDATGSAGAEGERMEPSVEPATSRSRLRGAHKSSWFEVAFFGNSGGLTSDVG